MGQLIVVVVLLTVVVLLDGPDECQCLAEAAEISFSRLMAVIHHHLSAMVVGHSGPLTCLFEADDVFLFFLCSDMRQI